ncbi:MAG: PEGA domain-containing protein [Lachnospiraceae bacterium]|nr:PEGA domain-containing protein [Lachnospiraceae bacterium]
MEDQNKLQSRKPNRNQYTAQRKAKYEKAQAQDEDLYALLKREREHQSSGVGSRVPQGGKKQATTAAAYAATAKAAKKTAAKAPKKVQLDRNADYYITTPDMTAARNAAEQHTSRKRKSEGPSGTAILGIIALFVVAIIAVTAFSIAAKHNKQIEADANKAPSTAPTKAPTVVEANREILAILERKDTANMLLQLYSIADGETLFLNYTSITDIRDKYDQQLVVGQLEIGAVVEVKYDSEQRKVALLQVSDEGWELKYQTGLTVSEDRSLVNLRSQTYEYTNALHVYDGDEQRSLEHISAEDTITLRGIGTEVYVIRVERGHGYLTLAAEKDYIGGNLYLNNDYFAQITEGMVLQIKEGTYEVTVENQDLTATIETTIARNETAILDLTEYARVPDPMCQVNFQISPSGAVLYLNGDSTYYKNPITLPYGAYTMKVESGGYVTYEGTLTINKATMTVSIDLPPEVEEPDDTDSSGGTTTDGENHGSGSSDNNDTGSDSDASSGDDDNYEDDISDNTSENLEDYQVDEENSIVIRSDEGVEVYLNGDYMGVIEDGFVAFTKYIGSFTLELVKGTETKSYVILVDDSGEDFEFSRYFK